MGEPSGLRRVLGLPAVTFVAVGFMIGGGVFVFTGIVLDVAGPALPLCYALAVVPVALATLPLVALAAALPATGANYRYPARMVSPGLAFTGVWVYALASFFGQIPLYALGCARYVASLAPGVPEVPLALALVTLFSAVNLLGVRLAAGIQGVCVLVLLGALGFYAWRGGAAFDATHLGDLGAVGPGGVLLGTALLTFTYFGANGVVELGGEIRDPGRVIPRAFAIAFPLVALVYVAVALAAVGCPIHEDDMGEHPCPGPCLDIEPRHHDFGEVPAGHEVVRGWTLTAPDAIPGLGTEVVVRYVRQGEC